MTLESITNMPAMKKPTTPPDDILEVDEEMDENEVSVAYDINAAIRRHIDDHARRALRVIG